MFALWQFPFAFLNTARYRFHTQMQRLVVTLCLFWFVRPCPYYTPEGIVDLHSGFCVGRELYPNYDILMLGQSLSQQVNPYGSEDSFAMFEGVQFFHMARRGAAARARSRFRDHIWTYMGLVSKYLHSPLGSKFQYPTSTSLRFEPYDPKMYGQQNQNQWQQAPLPPPPGQNGGQGAPPTWKAEQAPPYIYRKMNEVQKENADLKAARQALDEAELAKIRAQETSTAVGIAVEASLSKGMGALVKQLGGANRVTFTGGSNKSLRKRDSAESAEEAESDPKGGSMWEALAGLMRAHGPKENSKRDGNYAAARTTVGRRQKGGNASAALAVATAAGMTPGPLAVVAPRALADAGGHRTVVNAALAAGGPKAGAVRHRGAAVRRQGVAVRSPGAVAPLRQQQLALRRTAS